MKNDRDMSSAKYELLSKSSLRSALFAKRQSIFAYVIIIGLFFPLITHASPSYVKFSTCRASNCPLPPPLLANNEKLSDQVIVFETSRHNFMQRSVMRFSDENKETIYNIQINQDQYTDNAPILGFGGAFSDSAAILYHHLSHPLQENFIKAYYSFEGSAYTFGRVPIASTDFSCRDNESLNNENRLSQPSLGPCSSEFSSYTYADKPDDDLSSFALATEDIDFKIPLINDAMTKAHQNQFNISLFASPWSAPTWMKTNGRVISGHLKPFYYSLWADYFIKFLKAYHQYGITFWGITVQNEPEEHVILGKPFQHWQTMFFTAIEEGNFIKSALGPKLKAFEKKYGSPVNIMIHDDQISDIDKKMLLMQDAEVNQYVSGAALHWYRNSSSYLNNLDDAFIQLRKYQPNQTGFILATEACEGFYPFEQGPKLGNWHRGEAYGHDILSDLNHHVSGWVDWNLLLDIHGGPNWAKNYVDAPILVDVDKQILYLQPMYYYLAHFSRFIRPNAKQLKTQSNGLFPLETVSFRVPPYHNIPATIVTVVLNRDHTSRHYYLRDLSKQTKSFLDLTIPAHGIQTIIYKAN